MIYLRRKKYKIISVEAIKTLKMKHILATILAWAGLLAPISLPTKKELAIWSPLPIDYDKIENIILRIVREANASVEMKDAIIDEQSRAQTGKEVIKMLLIESINWGWSSER